MRVIEFAPPLCGFEGFFNTFRLGAFYLDRLKIGETVALYDNKAKLIFGHAVVESVYAGKLSEMLVAHAALNHTQLSNLGLVEPPEALKTVIKKLYGPHIATDSKRTTVIYLRRLNDQRKVDGVE